MPFGMLPNVVSLLSAHAVPGPGVVAVSGGADSVALLHALADAGVGPLTVAHVNHQLRGRDSDDDADFVERLGRPCRTLVADVRSLGGNLEAAARRVRYDWFEQVANDVGACWIATGHTADDQAETVLHRLVRGTGLQGLRGIAPRRGRVVRPLLGTTRADLLAYLAGKNQPYRTDATNFDPQFTRNRIRAELLPLLASFNPAIVAALGRVGEQADELFADLEGVAAADLLAVELASAGVTRVFDAAKLEALPEVRRRHLLRHAWHAAGWPANRMTAAHWKRLAALAIADYPDGISLRRAGRVVQLGPRS